ncbi:Uncharacterised protein [Klebsiella pneumoniae]|nr:Uncharacterised protein [Klebsiella pneumoniae]
MLPGGGYALPGLQAHTPQARASVAPPGEISGTVLLILPGSGCALPGLQDPLTGSHPAGPASAAPPGDGIRHGTLDFAGWRLRLTRPTGSSHRLTLRRPVQAQRRRARYQVRYPWYCRVAAAPYPAYRLLSQAHTPQARASVAPPGDCIRHGTLDFAGWRLRLTRPTGSSHRLTLRRPVQAQRRRARYQVRYPWYCRVAAAPYPAYRLLSQAHTPQARQAQRGLAVSFAGQLALVLLPQLFRPALQQ